MYCEKTFAGLLSAYAQPNLAVVGLWPNDDHFSIAVAG
jgi:hypothetical protein